MPEQNFDALLYIEKIYDQNNGIEKPFFVYTDSNGNTKYYDASDSKTRKENLNLIYSNLCPYMPLDLASEKIGLPAEERDLEIVSDYLLKHCKTTNNQPYAISFESTNRNQGTLITLVDCEKYDNVMKRYSNVFTKNFGPTNDGATVSGLNLQNLSMYCKQLELEEREELAQQQSESQQKEYLTMQNANENYYVFVETYGTVDNNGQKISNKDLVVLDPYGREFKFNQDLEKNLTEILTGQKNFMQNNGIAVRDPDKLKDNINTILKFLENNKYPPANGKKNLGLKFNATNNQCSIADFSQRNSQTGEYSNVLFKAPDESVRNSADNIGSLSRMIKLPQQNQFNEATQRPSIDVELTH